MRNIFISHALYIDCGDDNTAVPLKPYDRRLIHQGSQHSAPLLLVLLEGGEERLEVNFYAFTNPLSWLCCEPRRVTAAAWLLSTMVATDTNSRDSCFSSAVVSISGVIARWA